MARMERGKIIRDDDHTDDPDWFYDEDEGWQRRKPISPAAESYRARLQWIKFKAEEKTAAAGDDAAAIEAVEQWFNDALERADKQYEQAVEEAAQRSKMTKHDDGFKAAQAALSTGLIKAAQDLKALEARAATGEINEKFALLERERILTEARVGDSRAASALRTYSQAALAEARALRAQAAIGDPTSRMADEMERARLAQSPVDGDVIAAQALDMLIAGQPQRASFLLSVARDKGARLTDDVSKAIEATLDEVVPDRKAARDLESAVDANTAAYSIARLKALSESLGITAHGDVGNGSTSARASASVAAKMGAHLAPQPAGE